MCYIDSKQDAAESVQLLAVIDDFEKERRKGVELMEHILQQLNDMFYLEDAKIVSWQNFIYKILIILSFFLYLVSLVCNMTVNLYERSFECV